MGGAVFALLVIVGIISSATGGSKKSASAGQTNQRATPARQAAASTPTQATIAPAAPTEVRAPTPTEIPTQAPPPTPAPPKYKLQVTRLSCEIDALGDRVCTGTVTNIQPAGKNATDISPVVHWTGGTDSDLGTVDINPLLPGQSSPFTVYTFHPNPQLTRYTIGFKKIFGEESDYPVDPTPVD